MSDERFEADELGDDTIVGDSEIREALRLADVLDALDAGAPAPMSAIEDPELASLVRTAALLRQTTTEATETVSFQSYRARSRAYILHTLEEQQAAQRATGSAAEGRDGLVPFVRRRWTVLAPVAAAAAVAGFALFAPTVGAPDGTTEGGPTAASNLTAGSTDAELHRIQQAIALLSARAERGEPVDATLLRTITETSAAVANKIEAQPRLVSREHVATYQKAVTAGTTVLTTVQPAAGSENALAAAQRATQDGVVAAARYLGAEDPASTATTPTGTPTAAPTKPAATATPAPTAAPTTAPTPAPTSTPSPTPSATVTPAATATPPAPGEGSVRP